MALLCLGWMRRTSSETRLRKKAETEVVLEGGERAVRRKIRQHLSSWQPPALDVAIFSHARLVAETGHSVAETDKADGDDRVSDAQPDRDSCFGRCPFRFGSVDVDSA
jgi:hypothetical protein